MIAKQVADFTGETFWQVMNNDVMSVLTIATLLKEQVTLEENRNGKISS
ncbi:hypothetical protein ACVW0P_004499 [Mucilaginibacter sp. UYNi724]